MFFVSSMTDTKIIYNEQTQNNNANDKITDIDAINVHIINNAIEKKRMYIDMEFIESINLVLILPQKYINIIAKQSSISLNEWFNLFHKDWCKKFVYIANEKGYLETIKWIHKKGMLVGMI